MKIAHVSDCYLPRLGGIEMQVHDLAMRQQAAGHTVHIITATPRARHDGTRFELDRNVSIHRLTADLPFELPVHPRAGREIAAVLRAEQFDVVHMHVGVVSPFAFAGLPVVVAARLPLVVTVHSLWGYMTPAFRGLDSRVHWSRRPMVLSAVSEVAAAPIRRIAGPDIDVEVLPNGIDAQAWQVDALPREPDDVLFVAVMRLAPRKRPLPLLRILHQVRQLVPSSTRLRAIIVGEGPQRPAMQRYLRRHEMASWVELPGRFSREQLRELYRRADVFIAPADLESFGIAALEARTAGLPVVAKANSGIREFVAHGVEGLLATSDADLVSGLVRLARSAELRGRIACRNRETPPPMLWAEVLAKCEAAYKRAALLID